MRWRQYDVTLQADLSYFWKYLFKETSGISFCTKLCSKFFWLFSFPSVVSPPPCPLFSSLEYFLLCLPDWGPNYFGEGDQPRTGVGNRIAKLGAQRCCKLQGKPHRRTPKELKPKRCTALFSRFRIRKFRKKISCRTEKGIFAGWSIVTRDLFSPPPRQTFPLH